MNILHCLIVALVVALMLAWAAVMVHRELLRDGCRQLGGVPVAQACIRKDVVLEVK